MGARPGTRPPNAGKGRPKGPNKITKELKDLIRGALEDVGGQKYLAAQAVENPVAFLTLIGKIIPKDLNIGGQLDNPIISRIEIVPFGHDSESSDT